MISIHTTTTIIIIIIMIIIMIIIITIIIGDHDDNDDNDNISRNLYQWKQTMAESEAVYGRIKSYVQKHLSFMQSHSWMICGARAVSEPREVRFPRYSS